VTSEPSRKLSDYAPWVWRLEQLALWGVALVVGLFAAGPLDGVLALLVRLVPLAGLLICVAVIPQLRWRRWRWDVSPESIDIQDGTLTVRRTLIPMPRVQHVDTTSNILEQQLGLATVEVHTAAGSHKIPLLTMYDAGVLRDRIADLARNADEP
jgi:membrane protein YdbS with pleckstrin-like domain